MHAQKANSEYKIRGRLAHPGHISRVGQAWKADFVQVFAEDPQHKQHKLFKMPRGSRACEKCGEIIRYDARGYAHCSCLIWNDSIIKPISETAKQVRMRNYTKFAKRC